MAVEYEDYLKQIAELVSLVQAGKAEETPEKLDTPGKRPLYNNLQISTSATNGSGAADAHA